MEAASRTPQLQAGTKRLKLPGTDYEFAVNPSGHIIGLGSNQELLEAIGDWISSQFRLPVTPNIPKLRFTSSDFMISMRYGKGSAAAMQYRPDILALYDSTTKTIYLRRTWTRTSPVDISILVHEMVHHMQNEARLRFDCPEARETLAFEAQAAWLALFGTNLIEKFELDSFSVWARSTCMY